MRDQSSEKGTWENQKKTSYTLEVNPLAFISQKKHVYPEEDHVRNSQFMLAHMSVLESY